MKREEKKEGFFSMLATVILLSFVLVTSGCGFKDYNQAVSVQNTQRFQAFVKGVNEAKTEGARIAMSMAFAGNMGVQSLAKPETARDYIRTIAPFVTPLYQMFHKKEESSMSAGRDMYVNSSRADTTTSSAVTDTLGQNNESNVGYQPDYSTETMTEGASEK